VSIEITNFYSNYGTYLPVIIIFGYFAVAAGLKYIDEAYDRLTLDKKTAKIIAPIIILISIAVLMVDNFSTIFLTAYLVAVIIQKKIDIRIYKISLIIFVFLYVALELYKPLLSSIVLFMTFLLLILFDEQANAVADHYFLYRDIKLSPLLAYIFKFRILVLIGAIILFFMNAISQLYVFAILAWTFGYNLLIFISDNERMPKKMFSQRKHASKLKWSIKDA